MNFGGRLGTIRRRRRGVGGGDAPAPSLASTPDPITVAESATVGSTLATIAVLNPSGVYTFTLIDGGAPSSTATTLMDNADNTADILVSALDFETYPSLSVVVQADNGVDTPLLQSFSVTVTDVVETPSGNIAPILIAMGMI